MTLSSNGTLDNGYVATLSWKVQKEKNFLLTFRIRFEVLVLHSQLQSSFFKKNNERLGFDCGFQTLLDERA